MPLFYLEPTHAEGRASSRRRRQLAIDAEEGIVFLASHLAATLTPRANFWSLIEETRQLARTCAREAIDQSFHCFSFESVQKNA